MGSCYSDNSGQPSRVPRQNNKQQLNPFTRVTGQPKQQVACSGRKDHHESQERGVQSLKRKRKRKIQNHSGDQFSMNSTKSTPTKPPFNELYLPNDALNKPLEFKNISIVRQTFTSERSLSKIQFKYKDDHPKFRRFNRLIFQHFREIISHIISRQKEQKLNFIVPHLQLVSQNDEEFFVTLELDFRRQNQYQTQQVVNNQSRQGLSWTHQQIILCLHCLAMAIFELQSEKIVHLDIKRDNIYLIGTEKRIRLGDFDLALHLQLPGWETLEDSFSEVLRQYLCMQNTPDSKKENKVNDDKQNDWYGGAHILCFLLGKCSIRQLDSQGQHVFDSIEQVKRQTSVNSKHKVIKVRQYLQEYYRLKHWQQFQMFANEMIYKGLKSKTLNQDDKDHILGLLSRSRESQESEKSQRYADFATEILRTRQKNHSQRQKSSPLRRRTMNQPRQ